MAQVIVQVNGRNYTLQCEPGQEDHLRKLARMVDKEVAILRENVGAVGDLRLLLMASLVMADKLVEAGEKLAAMEKEIKEVRRSTAGQERVRTQSLLQGVEEATRRLEKLAASAGQAQDAAATDEKGGN